MHSPIYQINTSFNPPLTPYLGVKVMGQALTIRCPLIGLEIIILLLYCFNLQFFAQMKHNFIAKENYATHKRNTHMHNIM